MAYIKFKDSEFIKASALPMHPNVVRIITGAEPVLTGFRLYLDKNCKYPLDNREYESYTTLYRQGVGWYELSNDGSVYEEVAPVQPEELTEEQKQIADIRSRISNLKAQITETDYQVIKTYEYSLVGKESEYDIESLHEERQMLRDRINELEIQLAELTTE